LYDYELTDPLNRIDPIGWSGEQVLDLPKTWDVKFPAISRALGEFDSDTGLYYYKNRYYNQPLGDSCNQIL